MNCVREDLKAHITDVLVGEAETPVSEQVLSHLETCASCREDRDRMALVLGLLKEAPPWAATPASASSVSPATGISVRLRPKGSAATPASSISFST